MKQHKHAAVIHAWADGAEIEYRGKDGDQWMRTGIPEWVDHTQYRVKPEKVYPETRMTLSELNNVWGRAPTNEEVHALRYVANAALRHAIDAEQVVDPITYAEEVREAAGRRNASRDMAIAETAKAMAFHLACLEPIEKAADRIYEMVPSAIIATVKD